MSSGLKFLYLAPIASAFLYSSSVLLSFLPPPKCKINQGFDKTFYFELLQALCLLLWYPLLKNTQNTFNRPEVGQRIAQTSSCASNQARSEAFQIGVALRISARKAGKNFLAPHLNFLVAHLLLALGWFTVKLSYIWSFNKAGGPQIHVWQWR